MIRRLIVLAAALMSSSANAESVPRQPTGKWIVDFDDAQCVASRNYGTQKEPLHLAIKAPALGDAMQLAVIRPATGGSSFADEKDGQIAFDGGKPIKFSVLAVSVKKTKQRLFRVNLPLSQLDALRTAKRVSITAGGELGETFAVDELSPLLKVMEDCVSDLRKVWNVHEGEGPNPLLRKAPEGNLARVFTSDDYPADAFTGDVEGTSLFVVLIDESGKIADCTIVKTSGAASLDAQSCGIIQQRAHFTPAVGLDGKPAKSAFTQQVAWRLE
jgi:hypothetical protein